MNMNKVQEKKKRKGEKKINMKIYFFHSWVDICKLTTYSSSMKSMVVEHIPLAQKKHNCLGIWRVP